ncbi:DUF6078 family protein [Bacteroides sp.]
MPVVSMTNVLKPKIACAAWLHYMILPIIRILPSSIHPTFRKTARVVLIFKTRKRCVAWGVKELLNRIPHEDAVSIKKELIEHFGKTKYYRFYREECCLKPKDQNFVRQAFRNKGIAEEPPFGHYTEEYLW